MKYEIVQILTNRATIIINGAEYTITTKGEVFNKHGMALSIRPNTSGYASFTAGSKGVRRRVDIHRLVAELFLPNPNNYSDVDHKDSNRMNASLDNLEWIPHDVNVRRAYERGNHDGRATGEKNCKSKFVVNGRFCPQSVRSFCPVVAGFNAGTYKVPACVL